LRGSEVRTSATAGTRALRDDRRRRRSSLPLEQAAMMSAVRLKKSVVRAVLDDPSIRQAISR
jgi:hypothetical protein